MGESRGPNVTFRLVHCGRSVPRGLLKTAVALPLFVAAVVTPVVIWRWAGVIAALLSVLPATWLVDWAAPMLADGATDLISRWGWREIRSGRALGLDPHGVRYVAAVGREPGRWPEPDVVLAWEQVVAAEFRLGTEGSWWYCLYPAPSAWPVERSMAAVGAGAGLPGGSVPGEATSRRRLAENLLWFDTPVAVNLEVCPGARPRRIDRAVRRWTGGRLGCRSPEPVWWRPPRFPPSLTRFAGSER